MATLKEGGNLKKQIRDTQRLLSRANLPADIRVEKERKLAALKLALADHEQSEMERALQVTYKMVKFFDRKKAERHLMKAMKKNDDAAKEEAIKNINYIINFPKDRKYISLFPSVETSDERVLEERRNIRDKINEEMMARANVKSILEAPLPPLMSSKASKEDLPVKQALNPGHGARSSDDEDDDDEQEDDDDDEGSDDGDDSPSGEEEDSFDDEDDDESGQDGSQGEDSESDDSDDFGSDSEESDDSDEDDDEDEDSSDFDSESDEFVSDDDESDDSDSVIDDLNDDEDEEDVSAPKSKRSKA